MENNEYEDLRYISDTGNVLLEFVVDKKNKSVMFEYNTYNPKHVKIFLITLKKAINDFINKGLDTVQQRVTYDDWNNYLKKDTRWAILNHDKLTQTYVIMCKTADALDCIANGFGISESNTTYKTILRNDGK
jgi:hypothetical protein